VNILVTGNLSSLALSITRRLIRDQNKVVLVSYNSEKLDANLQNVAVHSINPGDPGFFNILSSYKFDVVIFLSTREEMLDDAGDDHAGRQLDALKNTLDGFRSENLRRFILISSTEIFGNSKDPSKDDWGAPASVNGSILQSCEQLCRFYHEHFDLNLTIARLPFVYGPQEKSGLLRRLIEDGRHNRRITLPGAPDTPCAFLHADDVADFVNSAVNADYARDTLTVNLSASNSIDFSELADMLAGHYAHIAFQDGTRNKTLTRPMDNAPAKKSFGWSDARDLKVELPGVVAAANKTPVKRSFARLMVEKFRFDSPLLPWVELIAGAALAFYLSRLTNTLIQFQYVDFRLVYVVVMGSIYGLRFGLYASILMGVFVIYTWLQLNVDWQLLVYNVGNWFPFVMYFAAGLIIGYAHDKTENQIINGQKQYQLLMEKYTFLFEVFNEVRALKDEFRERLIGYRDSFGKIFTITQELDKLQEHAVYLRALSILEELMNNKNIAIYSLDSSRTYARLEAKSPDMNPSFILKKSLKLDDYPELLESVEGGKIFQNTRLLQNYPAYAAPVFNNSYPFNVPVAMIVIWAVEFEQFSTYYYNLFKVICGLIEASLVRATIFLDANYSKMYLPTARIMNQEAFLELLKVRLEMKRSKVSDFQVILLEEPKENVEAHYHLLSSEIRAVDIVGMLRDGTCYILLSQADRHASSEIVKRLERHGIRSRLIETADLPLD